MSNLEIKNLLNYSRFPESELKILLAVVYLPIGLVLLILRCTAALFLVIFGQVLPDSPAVQSFLINLACFCFGITVSVENANKKEQIYIYVCNSLSVFDHVALSKAVGFVSPINKTPLQSLPGLGITDIGSINNQETFKTNIDKLIKDKKIPVLLCPEESSTNGQALLKFNAKYFSFIEKVQPVCISIKRPILDISVSTMGSTYLNDFLYFMFSPFTNYKIKFLPTMEKKSLLEGEFAEIVRENIASELKIEASPYSASDLAEWCKRQLAEEKRRHQERANARLGWGEGVQFPNPELARMATQVKEVLPHVPVAAIYNDLAVTRSVDTTITNILEGRVRFIPEVSSSSSVPSTSSQESISSSSPSRSTGNAANVTPAPALLNTGASSFGKTATERTKSFQERKDLLIAAARRRYIEKHNLSIPV